MKAYIDNNALSEKGIAALKTMFPEIDFQESPEAEVLICHPSYLNNYEGLNNVRWIQLLTAGYNTVDLDRIQKAGIVLTNARDVFSKTIAEDVFSKILFFNRNTKTYLENMRTQTWQGIRREPEICGSTVGLIGTGSIAGEIAKRMKAFEAKVIGYRRHFLEVPYFDEIVVGEDGLHRLLMESDIVVLAIPLNKETAGLIDLDKLRLMKPTALLINISRGEVIVQADLIAALKLRIIRGAGLDVTVPEPLPKDHELWKLDNVFITPHNSGSSPYVTERLVELIAKNLRNYMQGKELVNIVVS